MTGAFSACARRLAATTQRSKQQTMNHYLFLIATMICFAGIGYFSAIGDYMPAVGFLLLSRFGLVFIVRSKAVAK
jgi:hypothetical protein